MGVLFVLPLFSLFYMFVSFSKYQKPNFGTPTVHFSMELYKMCKISKGLGVILAIFNLYNWGASFPLVFCKTFITGELPMIRPSKYNG